MSKITKVILLISGYDTKFYPLSLNKPICLWKFRNEIIIKKQLETLEKYGIEHVYIPLSPNFQHEQELKNILVKSKISCYIISKPEKISTAQTLNFIYELNGEDVLIIKGNLIYNKEFLDKFTNQGEIVQFKHAIYRCSSKLFKKIPNTIYSLKDFFQIYSPIEFKSKDAIKISNINEFLDIQKTFHLNIIGQHVKIGKNVHIGQNVVIGDNVEISDNVKLENTCIFDNTKICHSAQIFDSIIGWNNIIGSWTLVQQSISSTNVSFVPSICVFHAKILCFKTISKSIFSPQVVL